MQRLPVPRQPLVLCEAPVTKRAREGLERGGLRRGWLRRGRVIGHGRCWPTNTHWLGDRLGGGGAGRKLRAGLVVRGVSAAPAWLPVLLNPCVGVVAELQAEVL